MTIDERRFRIIVILSRQTDFITLDALVSLVDAGRKAQYGLILIVWRTTSILNPGLAEMVDIVWLSFNLNRFSLSTRLC